MLADLTATLLIAASTFVSEDLACIGAGIAAASGKVSLFVALAGSMIGIFIGDLLLFAAGRTLGRAALSYPPLKWILKPEAVERSSEWFAARGGSLIFSSRFIPGMRLPTYFAAGMLHVPFLGFLGYFAGAAIVWTPLIVGVAYLAGDRITSIFQSTAGILTLTATGITLYVFLRLILNLASYRGRRAMAGWLKRWKWEFWPSWMAYPPVVFYCAFLALRYRRAIPFTVCNPGIPGSGLIGESKSDILKALPIRATARSLFLAADLTAATRLRRAKLFAPGFPGVPLVVKPDKGERGSGVVIVRTREHLASALDKPIALIVQEYVPGLEFGVMYARYPDNEEGQVISITRKIMPELKGDGRRSLERLILDDARAVSLAKHYLDVNRHRLDWIPELNESVQLVELGTHSRGSIFLDGAHFLSPRLTNAIDRISRHFKGFYLGRYDIRVPTEQDFVLGKNIKVLELNGVTSEPTHIYDPAVSILGAYRALFRHWRLAYEIGMQNIARGIPSWTIRELIQFLTKEWQGRSGEISKTKFIPVNPEQSKAGQQNRKRAKE
ncbi:MAG: VTT domain-containing protein [Leptospirales bacterium]|nr:VTT domain-containing protein [Leptospirales bacterium]